MASSNKTGQVDKGDQQISIRSPKSPVTWAVFMVPVFLTGALAIFTTGQWLLFLLTVMVCGLAFAGIRYFFPVYEVVIDIPARTITRTGKMPFIIGAANNNTRTQVSLDEITYYSILNEQSSQITVELALKDGSEWVLASFESHWQLEKVTGFLDEWLKKESVMP